MKKNVVFALILLLSIGLYFFVQKGVGEKQAELQSTSKPINFKTKESDSSLGLSFPNRLKITTFADGVTDARDLTLSPDNVLLVSQSDQGIVSALPDKNRDGKVDEAKVVLENLDRPHGIAFYKGKLFVATRTSLQRYSWNEEKLEANLDKELFQLPGTRGHTRYSIVFDKNGRLFVSLGSSCNVCIEEHPWKATVIVTNENGDTPRVFAKGLRNAPFLAIHPDTDELWGTEMGRDYLGDELPPDEINRIQGGKNYGWPLCFADKIHDRDFDKNRYTRNPCEETENPIFKIPAHSAPLGLTFIESNIFPPDWQKDLLVAYHGSWNRTSPTGYKIVRLKLNRNQITEQEDFITGFIPENAQSGDEAIGRPVDLLFNNGDLYISDDKAGKVYRVTKK